MAHLRIIVHTRACEARFVLPYRTGDRACVVTVVSDLCNGRECRDEGGGNSKIPEELM